MLDAKNSFIEIICVIFVKLHIKIYFVIVVEIQLSYVIIIYM